MPDVKTFNCPSCGSSLSAQGGAAEIKCQYCGNTVVVPEQLRAPSPSTITIHTNSSMAEGIKIDLNASNADWSPNLTNINLTTPFQPWSKWLKVSVWAFVILIIVTTVVPILCAFLGMGAAFLPFFLPR
jgi:LSD1 subclass zinc finger protein